MHHSIKSHPRQLLKNGVKRRSQHTPQSIPMLQEHKSLNKVRNVEIAAERAGQRLDNYLLSELKRLPRSLIYRIIRKGEVRVNKSRVKPEYKLQANDVVRIPPISLPSAKTPQPIGNAFAQALMDAVLYESDGLLIINKPAGIAVHGGSGVNLGLIESLKQALDYPYLELIHRLDRGTSGCLMVAKKRSTLRALHQQLRQRGQIQKHYHALVLDQWSEKNKQVALPLLKYLLASGERMVKVDPMGKDSLTRVRVINVFKRFSLLQLQLVTGRTHQIRVHCQAMGHPIIGDEKYGSDAINMEASKLGFNRMFLHAAKLSLVDPSSNQSITIEAPYDKALTFALQKFSTD